MPPKNSKKIKPIPTPIVAAPPTPPAQEARGNNAQVTKKKGPKKKSAAKGSPEVPYHLLSPTDDAIKIAFSSEVPHRFGTVDGNGEYAIKAKIHGPQPLEFVATEIIEAGPHAGLVAIIVKPQQAFPLMKLSPEVRNMIFEYVCAPKGEIGGRITISATVHGLKAKEYMEGTKDRLGFMKASKELLLEGRKALFVNQIKFDDTTVLTNFLIRRSSELRKCLRFIEIAAYKKQTAESALSGLAECSNLQRIHISTGVALNCTPTKGAKQFFHDAESLLRALVAAGPQEESHEKRVELAVDIFRFGNSTRCFSVKEGDGEVRAWTQGEKVTFQNTIEGLLNHYTSGPIVIWACICGTQRRGHICFDEMRKRYEMTRLITPPTTPQAAETC